MRVSAATLSFFATFVTGSLLIGCGDDDSNNQMMPDAPPAVGTATFRVVHASPDAPAVDVYAEGVATPLISNLAYGQASNYLEVDEGTYNLQVRAAGGTDVVYETGDLALAADARITAVAAGFIGSTADGDKFRVLPLAESFAGVTANQTSVRIVHASADAPTVGIDVGNDNPAAPEVASLARFADTGAAGVALPAGSALQIGIAAGGNRVTAFTTPSLPAQTNLFVIATGRLSNLPRESTGFSLLAVGPSGVVGMIKQNPTVHAVHASPDTPPVDIRAGAAGPILAADLAFGEMGAIQVPPGDYSLAFFATGQTGTPAATAAANGLAAGERYLALATGMLTPASNEGAFQLVAAAEAFSLTAGARIRVSHASPDAPAVDVSTVSGGQMVSPALVTNAAFPAVTAAAGIDVPSASIPVGIAATGSSTPVATFTVNTTSNPRAFVVAAGALSPVSGEEAFRLLVVNTAVWPWTIATINPN